MIVLDKPKSIWRSLFGKPTQEEEVAPAAAALNAILSVDDEIHDVRWMTAAEYRREVRNGSAQSSIPGSLFLCIFAVSSIKEDRNGMRAEDVAFCSHNNPSKNGKSRGTMPQVLCSYSLF